MYRAPTDEIAFTLLRVAGLGPVLEAGLIPSLSEDLVSAVLVEAGRFATEEIAPLRRVGDEQGATLNDAVVTTPAGWRELYKRWTEGGWNAVQGPEAFGGQGLPTALGLALLEMWNSGSMAFGIGPTLTMAAVEAIARHGTDDLKSRYLRKLVSGEWMGTMNLTEPQAGSDLSVVKTRAEPTEDGTYRIFGQKIFITYGEHDFTDNIVHLVLARLPDAPLGTRGLSLFLVPKILVNGDGSLGGRNDVFCFSLEHKLGIHASPTCTMIFGDGFRKDAPKGAVGWLLGEKHRGLACMFTMMNNARLAVGIQGVAVAEAAFQLAHAYSKERRQGKTVTQPIEGMAPIVYHPDVQRNLLTMKSLTAAARAVSYSCAVAIDQANLVESAAKQFWTQRANLLTPVAKAFSTDVGVEVTSLGLQVHGGMGFIEETGAAMLFRDARIGPIYEGTNGIQAIDLVTRKLPVDSGQHVFAYIDELKAICDEVRASGEFALGDAAENLGRGIREVSAATQHLLAAVSEGRSVEALAGATPYLRLLAIVAGGAYLARGAFMDRSPERLALARFYAGNIVSEAEHLRRQIVSGASSLVAAADSLIN